MADPFDTIVELTFDDGFYSSDGAEIGSYSGDVIVDFSTDRVLSGELSGSADGFGGTYLLPQIALNGNEASGYTLVGIGGMRRGSIGPGSSSRTRPDDAVTMRALHTARRCGAATGSVGSTARPNRWPCR